MPWSLTLSCAGKRTTKRAPRPSSGGSSCTVPWWLSATARTIASPSPEEPERSPWARKKRSKTLSCSSARDARAVVLDREHDVAVGALDAGLDRGAGVGVAQRVLHQVQHEPVQLVLHALDLEAARAPRSRSRGRPRPARARTAASVTTLERSTGRCGGSRPASARASSSRSATRRRIRRLERSAEAAASRCSPSQRLLEQLEVGQHGRQRRAQLVRGVGDELALARERRLGLRARVVERVQHRLERRRRARRPRRRPPGAASAARGRACARSRARRRSARRSAPSRGARSPGRRAAPARCRRARRGRGTASRGWRSRARRRSGGRTGRRSGSRTARRPVAAVA